MTRKTLSYDEALQKIRAFCAYQERPHQDVQSKLYSYGLHKGDVDEITTQLITEGFLNEERFARAFSGGKFRVKKWGRIKIAHALESKGLTPRCIQAGLSEIEDEDYRQTLQNLLENKVKQIAEIDPWARKHKLASYAIQRGFESELVWELVREMPE